MSDFSATAHNPFDETRPYLLSLYMTLVGYSVLVALPAINSAWVDQLGFTDVEVNRVASADLLGLFLGSVAAAFFISKFNRQHLIYAGIVIAIVANWLCINFTSYEQMLWLRCLAGFGSGVYTGVAVAGLGARSKPREAFNIMLLAFAVSQFLELQLIPLLSMDMIYVFFIATYVVTIPFVRWMPTQDLTAPSVAQATETTESRPSALAWVGIFAIVVAYINIGAYWANIELAAEDAGLDGNWAGQVISWTVLLSFVGCFTAMYTLKKLDYDRPILVTFVLMILAVGALAVNFTAAIFLLSVALFNFLWIFIDVYQMGGVSIADRSGSRQMLGPLAASFLLDFGWGFTSVFVLCAIASGADNLPHPLN